MKGTITFSTFWREVLIFSLMFSLPPPTPHRPFLPPLPLLQEHPENHFLVIKNEEDHHCLAILLSYTCQTLKLDRILLSKLCSSNFLQKYGVIS